MDLTSSELPNEIQKITREDSVKKIVYHAKTDHVPANYVLEMHYDFDDDNKPSVYTGYTRYEIYLLFRCLINYFIYVYIFFNSASSRVERKR